MRCDNVGLCLCVGDGRCLCIFAEGTGVHCSCDGFVVGVFVVCVAHAHSVFGAGV